MSTSAMIYKSNPDGSFTGVYVHYDGYPSGLGTALVTAFSEEEKVDALIALGSLSSVSDDGSCVAYHRDRGEAWAKSKPLTLRDRDAVVRKAYDVDYTYVWYPDAGWRCGVEIPIPRKS